MRKPPRGVALISILVLLVLLAALVLAIFSSTRTERISSSLYTGGVEAGNLADTVVNLCIAQITDATAQPLAPLSEPDAPPPPLRTWVSQPGMIRTFHGDRQPGDAYRLYSWGTMRVSGAFDPFDAANQIPSDWNQLGALYVDLNEPTPDLDAPMDSSRYRYPILYPPQMTASSEGGPTPEGYEVSTPPGSSSNPVPMPVQWLYVLNDGSIHPAQPTAAPGSVRVSAATRDNPITGRIAFWVDDESSKVNLNTAAGGEYWSPAWVETELERAATVNPGVLGFGLSLPVRGEYQRFPGHPARTDLRAVFPELSWEEIYALAPRIVKGGSENGKVRLLQTSIPPDLDIDRLYAATGELRFAMAKAAGNSPRELNAPILSSSPDQIDLIERRKGFLTTASRAPELTLFGTPRVAIWPIHENDTAPSNSPYRSPLDKLIAFCATIGGNPFYFTRNNPHSASEDISLPRNEALYRYLQRLTSSTPSGVAAGSFAQKYTPRGRDQILTQIFDYIRFTNLQDMTLPENRAYSVRATVLPTRWDAGNGETTGFGRTYTIRQAGLIFICNADGTIPESNRPPGTPAEAAGIQENISLEAATEANPQGGKLDANQRRVQALFFVELFSPAAGYKQFNHSPTISIDGLDTLTIKTPQMEAPLNLGFPASAVASPPGASGSNTTGLTGMAGGAANYRWPMLGSPQLGRDLPARPPFPADADDPSPGYPFVSVPVTITINPANPQISINGAQVTVKVYNVANPAREQIAETTLDLEAVTLPAPQLFPPNPSPAFAHVPNPRVYWAFHKRGIFGDFIPKNPEEGRPENSGTPGRFYTAVRNVMDPHPNAPTNRNQFKGFITPYDTVQSYRLPHGDYRMMFGPTDQLKAFEAVPLQPGSPYPNLRHHLADGTRAVVGFAKGTTLAPDAGVRWSGENTSSFWAPVMRTPADYPADINAPWTFGDWDTGSPWTLVDGPLINKPDEGNLFQFHNSLNAYGSEYSLPGANGVVGTDYHSTNRQVPSPVMFGSLPTGLISGKPWQTLLFRPTSAPHPGKIDPPDDLLLDLFWMPVVEPYAISEPFSTAGKVNLNFQMIPFTYIDRATGMHALLRNEKIPAIPNKGWSAALGYGKIYPGYFPPEHLYHPVHIEATLQAFRERFARGEVFITPSEITRYPLVPDFEETTDGNTFRPTHETMDGFWERHQLTGENIKERPYAVLYPRVTTQSNVFNVHYRVQRLKKGPSSDPQLWVEGEIPPVAELRGNTIIERYIDPSQPGLPDFATDTNARADEYYRFRILSNTRFTP